jgi:hypothetical protein
VDLDGVEQLGGLAPTREGRDDGPARRLGASS